MLMTDTFAAAYDNLIKSRGTPDLWFLHRGDYQNQPPKPRVRLDAIEIANKNQQSISMAELSGFVPKNLTSVNELQTNEDEENQRRIRLRTNEAQTIARKSQSQTDKWYSFEENLNYQPPAKPYRIGASQEGLAIIENMTHTNDWFKHNAEPKQSINLAKREFPTYSRRNEESNWFVHNSYQPNKEKSIEEWKTKQITNECRENAVKNQGVSDLFTMKVESCRQSLSTPYGCPTKDAQLNAFWSKKGSDMAQCLNTLKNLSLNDSRNEFDYFHQSSACRPRSAAVRGQEAEEWRMRDRNGCMGSSMFFGSQQDQCFNACRVRQDGEDIMRKSINSSQMSSCLQAITKNKLDAPVNEEQSFLKYRLRSENALEAYKRNQGQMSEYLGSSTVSVCKPSVRKFQTRSVRGLDARETALQNAGSVVKELINNYRLPPHPLRTGFAHISPEAREIAELNQKGMIKGLIGEGRVSNIPLVGVEAPAPRRVQYEAVEYANRNQGHEMNNLIKQIR